MEDDGDFRRPAVARASVEEVVTAAKNFGVTPWRKFYNNQWNENGIGGEGAPVLYVPREPA